MISARQRATAIVALAATYFVASRLPLATGDLGQLGARIWAPSGIALAALLIWGRGLWPGIALGAFLVVVSGGGSPFAGIWLGAIDSLEALVAWWLLRRVLHIRAALDRAGDVVAMIAVAFAVTFASSFVAVIGLDAFGWLRGETFVVWPKWWWSHLSADLVVAPVVLTWAIRGDRTRGRRRLEAIALSIVLVAAALLVFHRTLEPWVPGVHGPYLLVPLLVWAALRFEMRGASAATLTVAVVAMVGGQFAPGRYPITDLQLFIAVTSVTCLVLSALAHERLQAIQRKTAIQETALDAIITIDEHCTVVELNPAAERLFGYSALDAIGRKLPPRVFPASVCAAEPANVPIGRRVRFDARRADGSEFPAEIAATVAHVAGGTLVTGFLRDVTAEHTARAELEARVQVRTAELVEANARIAREQELMRQAQELAHLGSFEVDLTRDRLEWSDELFRIFGRDPGTLPPTHEDILASVHPQDRARVRAALVASLTEGAPFGVEARIVRPDGSVRSLQARARLLADDQGHARRFVGCCQDITERTQGEHARHRLAELVESSGDAIIALSLDGVIESWNAAACLMFGYVSDEVIGRSADLLVPASERERLHEYLAAIRSGDRRTHHELVHQRRDGSRFDASVTMSPIIDHQNRVIGLSKVVRDITEQKTVEQKLRASLREKEVLLREIYHRVKNNLQVISSLLNLQVANEPSPQARRGLLESQSRIQSMAIVHQLLYQSKDLARIDFSEYLRSLCDRLLRTYNVGDDRIAIEVRAPTILLDIDQAIASGLIVNELVANALHHAFPDNRSGHIRVTLEPVGEFLQLRVADDGIGIPPGIELESVHTFGLQIARTLTQQLRGTIELVRDHGTTVRVLVPLLAQQHAAA